MSEQFINECFPPTSTTDRILANLALPLDEKNKRTIMPTLHF